MARSIPARCNPNVVAWARNSAGYDVEEAAAKLSIEPELLRSWEAGTEIPSLAKLRRVAELCKRPLAVFFLSEVPHDFSPLRDFRQLPKSQCGEFSPELRFLIRQTQTRHQWLTEQTREEGGDRLQFVGSATLEDDIEKTARHASKILDFTPANRRAWGKLEDARRWWISRCEDCGVFVFQSSKVPIEEMRGFVIPDEHAPAILVNAKDSEGGRIFSILHEFVHILLGTGGVSNFGSPRSPTTEEERIERFCNAVAAEVLVPHRELTGQLSKLGDISLDSVIIQMAKHFRVSREVIARRFLDHGRITRQDYLARREIYRRDYVESREKLATDGGFPLFHVIKLRDNGRAFTRSVLGAYDDGDLNGSDVADLLNMKLTHLPKIEAILFPAQLR